MLSQLLLNVKYQLHEINCKSAYCPRQVASIVFYPARLHLFFSKEYKFPDMRRRLS